MRRVHGKYRQRRIKALLPPHTFDDSQYETLCLTLVLIIHYDERWYRDGEPKWKGAITAAIADKDRTKAAKRLSHINYEDITGAASLALILGSCTENSRCGSHACPECGRADQRWLVWALKRVLRDNDPGYEDYSFNFVMPDGQVGLTELSTAPFDHILRKCREALKSSLDVLFAVVGIDVSFNDDSLKFEKGRLSTGPRCYWQIHVYGIARVRHRDAIRTALNGLFVRADNIYRPLKASKTPFDSSARGLSYICKTVAFRHVAIKDKRGDWNTPKEPRGLTAEQQVHYLLAIHALGFSRRVAFVGLHPVKHPTAKNPKGMVILRRVYRGRPAM